MKLTKNSWHYNAYLFLTGEEPNNNFCDYFWELLFNVLFSIVNLPFYVSSLIYSKYENAQVWDYSSNLEYNVRDKTFKEKLLSNNKIPFFLKFLLSVLIYLLIIILVIGLMESITKTLLTILGIIGFISLVIGIVYFFTESETKDKIVDNLSEIKHVAVEGFSSFKNNYCPKIDWTDKN